MCCVCKWHFVNSLPQTIFRLLYKLFIFSKMKIFQIAFVENKIAFQCSIWIFTKALITSECNRIRFLAIYRNVQNTILIYKNRVMVTRSSHWVNGQIKFITMVKSTRFCTLVNCGPYMPGRYTVRKFELSSTCFMSLAACIKLGWWDPNPNGAEVRIPR